MTKIRYVIKLRPKAEISSTNRDWTQYIFPQNDTLGWKTLKETKEAFESINKRRIEYGIETIDKNHGVLFVKRMLTEEIIE